MKQSVPRRNGVKPATTLSLPISHELKDAVGEAAEQAGLAMNEWVAKLLAEHFGRPELAAIPRKPFGRPRKLAEAV
jgi:hypothetical protein